MLIMVGMRKQPVYEEQRSQCRMAGTVSSGRPSSVTQKVTASRDVVFVKGLRSLV